MPRRCVMGNTEWRTELRTASRAEWRAELKIPRRRGRAKGRPETGMDAAGISPANHPVSGSPLSACIRFGWQVTAPGGGWRGFSIQPSIQSSTQSSIQSSVLGSAIRHLSSIQSSIQQSYVVTRSRPYPRQTRSARGAAPTPRPFTPAPIPGPSPSPLGLQMSGFEAPLQAQSGTFPLADC